MHFSYTFQFNGKKSIITHPLSSVRESLRVLNCNYTDGFFSQKDIEQKRMLYYRRTSSTTKLKVAFMSKCIRNHKNKRQ